MAGWISVGVVVVAACLLLRYQKRTSDQRFDAMRRQFNQAEESTKIWRTRAGRFETAINRLRHGVVLLSPENRFVVLNPAACYLLNIGDDLHWKDQPFVDLIRFPDMNRAITAAKNGEGVQKVSVEVPIDDGVRSVKARVTKIETFGFDGMLVSLQDETDAMLLDQMRREFVANTSHELKTPLAAIKGYAETVELAIADDPDAAQHFMRQINVECLRLERLIEDMMQLARAQSDNPSLAISDIHLRDVIEKSLSSNRPVAKTKSIELFFQTDEGQEASGVTKVHMGPEDSESNLKESETGSEIQSPLTDGVVRADAEATLTIINNLISNAIRYTPKGGKVTVGIRDAEEFFSVYVHDTGIGISPSDQKRVFERFYRGNGKRQYEGPSDDLGLAMDRGTGIGLSIVKQLTGALGGKVQLSSVPGVGSRFEVMLPKA